MINVLTRQLDSLPLNVFKIISFIILVLDANSLYKLEQMAMLFNVLSAEGIYM